MSGEPDYDDGRDEQDFEEFHPSDLYCGVCGLDYPCGGPCDSTSMYSPPANYLDRKSADSSSTPVLGAL